MDSFLLTQNSAWSLQSRKYLWMHSAWFMTEALRHTSEDNAPLQLPTNHVYIELEQPQQVHALQFAACSLLRVSDEGCGQQRWKYDLITREGKVNCSLLYEYDTGIQQGRWTVPKDFTCSQQRCQVEETPAGKVYRLCETCQEQVSYAIS